MSSSSFFDSLKPLSNWTDGHAFTSNIVWCEEKYAISSFVAEFWNATTNIPFVSVGLLGIYRGIKNSLPLRFLLCYFFVCLIGTGSFLFHATLRYEFQMLDEFPMLLLAAQAIFSLAANRMVPIGVKVITGLAIYSSIIFSMGIYIIYNIAVLFQVMFGVYMAAIIHMSYRIWQHASKNGREGMSLGDCMVRALAYNALAFALWLVDVHKCESLRYARSFVGQPWDSFLQFHAWWHILTALGLLWFIAGLILSDPFSSPHYRVDSYQSIFPLVSRSKALFKS